MLVREFCEEKALIVAKATTLKVVLVIPQVQNYMQ